jgi:predicted alpha/beta superfamily hydrolase
MSFLFPLAAAVTALVTAPALAQSPVPLDYLPALKGGYLALDSAAAKHRYHIYVRLPDGYEAEPTRQYPIVYLLDGDSLFPILAANHIFLTYDDKIPEAIVVGIAYGSFATPINRRHIDFVPPGVGVPPGEAGAEAFQAFLKAELLPAVEQRYRADPSKRILFGQSRGGAMVLYSAFTDPDTFWARIASNPSMEPGREIIFGKPNAATRKDLRLIVASGTNEEPARRQKVLEWSNHWKDRAGPWHVQRIDIERGTHAANSPDVYRQALRLLFPETP